MSAFPCNGNGNVPKDFSARSIAGNNASFQKLKADSARVGILCVDQIIGSECCDETTAIVTSSQITVFSGMAPMINVMQNVAVDQFLFGSFVSQFAQFDLPIFDNAGLWDNTLKAFRVQEAGRYVISFQVTMGLLPAVPPPNTVYPNAYAGLISVRNADDTPRLVVAGDIQNGTPSSLTADGLGLIIVSGTTIADLEVGELVRVVLKAVFNAGGYAGGTVVAAGQIETNTVDGSSLLRASSFSINKLSKR